jgi:hypothetical protein
VIEEAVEAALKVAPGGSAYFDALDERLRQPGYFEALEIMVREHHGYVPPVVVTGQFGQAYADWRHATNRPRPFVLPGGLRFDSLNVIGERLPILYPGSKVVILDDSIYSGKTRQEIIEWLDHHGATAICTHVLYDGAPERIPGVHPMFRYHP